MSGSALAAKADRDDRRVKQAEQLYTTKAVAVVKQRTLSGTVVAVSRATLRVDGMLYLFSAQVPVVSASYPPRRLTLENGMRIRFKVADNPSGGMSRVTSVKVLGP